MLAAVLLLLAPLGAAGRTVMVVPPAAAAEAEWVGELVAAELPRHLALLGVPVIAREDRLRAHEALEIPAITVTRATSIRVAEALGAVRVVTGSATVRGDAVALSLRVLDVEKGTLSAPLVASGASGQIGALLASMAWEVATADAGTPALSRDALRAAVLRVPAEALTAYGHALAARGTVARVTNLRRAVSLAPGFDAARLELGRVWLEAREFSAAHEVVSHVPRASPLGRQARFLSGLADIELGRYADAARTYAELAREQPSAAALNNQAISVLRAGTPGTTASELLRQAVELDRTSRDVAFNVGWALLRERQSEAAVFWLRGVVAREPLDGQARLVLAWALRLAGRAAEADAEWKGVLAMAPSLAESERPDLTRFLARVLPSERLLAVDREARSDSELAATLLGRAERLGAAGDHDAALRELSRAAYLDPYRPMVHVLLARAHRGKGDLEKAENELRMALWSHDDAAVRLELAAVLKQQGRAAEARAEADRVLKADPRNAEARRLRDAP